MLRRRLAYASQTVSLCFTDCQLMTVGCHNSDRATEDVMLNLRYRLLAARMTLTCVALYTLHHLHLTR